MHTHGRRRLPVEQESRRRLKRQRLPTTIINGQTFVLTRPLPAATQPVQPQVTPTLGQTITAIGANPVPNPTPRPADPSLSPPSSTSSSSSSSSPTSRAVPTPSISVNGNAGSNESAEPVQTSSQNGTLPGGAIAGIVIGCLVVLVTIFVILLRKRLMRNRKKKRSTWAAANPAVSSSDIIVSGGNRYGEKVVAGPGPSISAPMAMAPGALVPPPFAYNNSHPSSVYSSPAMAPYSITGTPTPSASGSLGNSATVKSTFIPNLPDEMSIHIGEIVRVLAEYDDGWVLCSNGSGERGMVPLECLERSVGLAFNGSGASSGGPSRRASSLATYPARV